MKTRMKSVGFDRRSQKKLPPQVIAIGGEVLSAAHDFRICCFRVETGNKCKSSFLEEANKNLEVFHEKCRCLSEKGTVLHTY
ncbi:unnamed protein product [Caenorhabditis nigoni]